MFQKEHVKNSIRLWCNICNNLLNMFTFLNSLYSFYKLTKNYCYRCYQSSFFRFWYGKKQIYNKEYNRKNKEWRSIFSRTVFPSIFVTFLNRLLNMNQDTVILSRYKTHKYSWNAAFLKSPLRGHWYYIERWLSYFHIFKSKVSYLVTLFARYNHYKPCL